MNGIEKAVAKAGGVPALAALVGTSRQLVDYWLEKGVVSAGFVIGVYDATGVAVHELNPAIYPKARVKVS